MKLNPNMTLKEMHDYCSERGCSGCEYFRESEDECKFRIEIPTLWKFEEPSQVREVKRHAKVGEYIKIVNSADCRYENGDILKVSRCGSYGVIVGSVIYIDDSAYVVLENYVPDQKETAPSAGDTENSGYKNTYGKSIGSEFQNVNTLIGINTDGSLIIKQLKPAANGGANE
ncbi:MAG: hypothetical protein E7572_05260 [Ruminococcaceae bacterium]|nr:hypothetical protein [Oscillospiraceae bacterium]